MQMTVSNFSEPSLWPPVNQFSALPIVLLFMFVVSGQSIKPLHGIGSNNRTVCTVVASLFAEKENYRWFNEIRSSVTHLLVHGSFGKEQYHHLE